MIANIVMALVLGFVVCWWIVQIVGEVIGGRKMDDPFELSEIEVSQDK